MTSNLSRYKGCLVGGVVGDCIGQVFEHIWDGPIAVQQVMKEAIGKIESDAGSESSKKPRVVWEFTDDTAMARSVVKSLTKCNGFDARDMAKRFTDEFHAEMGRGYGGGVVSVFRQLKANNCEDIFGPASKQFDGQGSYGNGGAMRISPAGLFAHQKKMDFSQLKDMVEGITKLTHTHIGAIHGAILQCYAVHQALNTSQLNIDNYVDELKAKMKILEDEHKDSLKSEPNSSQHVVQNDSEETGSDAVTETSKTEESYCSKLEKIRKFAQQEQEPSPKLIEDELGTGISAFEAVPAAIYSFLRASKNIQGVEDRNPFERTVIYAISLGGDTDTIATMAGSISGAYYGVESIPQSWCKCCEGAYEAMKDAQLLIELT